MRSGPTSDCVIALDVGTTTIKAGLFTTAGELVALSREATPSAAPHVGWLEHDPLLLWEAVSRALRATAAAARGCGCTPGALAITGPRGTACLLDARGLPLTPFVTWQDRRSLDMLPALRARLGGDHAFYRRTGVRLDPSMIAPKLAWWRLHRPVELATARWVATTQGYVAARLTGGRPATDRSTAAFFGLIDFGQPSWSDELVEACGVPAELLPPVVEPGTVLGTLNRDAARELGLPDALAVVLAGSDGVCSELGAGATRPGQVYGYLGTAAAVATPLLEPRLDPDEALLVSPGSVAGRWRALGLGFTGASGIEWWSHLAGIDDPAQYDRVLADSPPGARGVLFMATVNGAGTPYWQPSARGAFVGLSSSHGAADLARAVYEGVALDVRMILGAFRSFGVPTTELRLTGGGARSDAWSALLAHIFQLPVERVDHAEPGLLGSAGYALTATGTYDDAIASAEALRAPSERFDPDPALAPLYDELAGRYDAVRRAFAASELDERLAQDAAGED